MRVTPQAFSLVEVMIASVILMVVVAILGSIASHVGKMWTEVNGQNQRRMAGRALLQFIVRDLQSASIPLPSSPLVSTTNRNLQFLVNCNIPSSYMNPHAIFWQAPVATNANAGNIAEIGYFVQWDTTTTPGKAKAYLCRYYSDATKPSFGIYTSAAASGTAAWLMGSGDPKTIAPATPGSKYSGWLADNVIALWVRCMTGGTNNQPITSPLQGSLTSPCSFLDKRYCFDSNRGYRNPNTGYYNYPPALPPCVEITLVVVDSYTAQRITAPLTYFTGYSSTNFAPANYDKPSTQQGSVLYYLNQLPASIRSGAEVFSTTAYLQSTTN